MNSLVALIPARAGSVRIPKKNIKPLAGHPLIAYTIAAARESGIFDAVVVSTESTEIAEIARHYGAAVPWLRPGEFAQDQSPDIEWVRWTLNELARAPGYGAYEHFSILRPTSPFRSAEAIRRAWRVYESANWAAPAHLWRALRAVETARQHPLKMWGWAGNGYPGLISPYACPVMADQGEWGHSRPTQSLPLVFVQNATMEIAPRHLPMELSTIAGLVVVPFFTCGHEGHDINDERDWVYAEHLILTGGASLPVVRQLPWTMIRGGWAE